MSMLPRLRHTEDLEARKKHRYNFVIVAVAKSSVEMVKLRARCLLLGTLRCRFYAESGPLSVSYEVNSPMGNSTALETILLLLLNGLTTTSKGTRGYSAYLMIKDISHYPFKHFNLQSFFLD